jgi:hypothetical protein
MSRMPMSIRASDKWLSVAVLVSVVLAGVYAWAGSHLEPIFDKEDAFAREHTSGRRAALRRVSLDSD